MRDLAEVDYDKHKEICALLNEEIDEPFKVVGVTKDVLVSVFVETVEGLSDQEQGELPDAIIDHYNMLFADEAEGAQPEEQVEPADDKGAEAAAKAKEEEAAVETKDAEVNPADQGTTGDEKAPKGDGEDKPEKKKRQGPIPYITFNDLQTWLGEQTTPTSAMDRFLLEGGKIKEILERFTPVAKDSSFKGFKTISSINSHISYREGKGWKYKKQGEGDDQTVQLVGYER